MSTLSPVQQLILQHFVLLPEDKTAFYRWQRSQKTMESARKNPEKKRAISRAWKKKKRKENPEFRAQDNARNRASIARRRREDAEFRAHEKGYNKQWRGENGEHLRTYARNRRRSDPEFRLVKNLRSRVLDALNGNSKSAPTLQLIGCTVPEWCAHLEAQFRPGMDWENYGQVWEIDHVKPCAGFDLTDPAQQRTCFHWSNTQPLFAEENLKKGDRE